MDVLTHVDYQASSFLAWPALVARALAYPVLSIHVLVLMFALGFAVFEPSACPIVAFALVAFVVWWIVGMLLVCFCVL